VTDPADTRSRRGPLFWFTVGGAAVVVVLMAWIFMGRADPQGGYNARQPTNNPTDGRPVDMSTQLPYLDESGTFTFSEVAGDIVVFNFWASYCIPCRAEHTELTETFADYREQGVSFVGIVYHDEPPAARAFLDTFGWGDGYIYVDDPDGRVTVDFGVFGVPETFIVDRNGIIVRKFFGEVDRNDLIPEIEALLAADGTG
jgi:cytochrome c biogenesis protein CcmG/thiol:disulfide interchange protein DsbE